MFRNSSVLASFALILAKALTVGQASVAVLIQFLHKLFNHANADKVHRTLGVTQGYKQPSEPLPGCYCQSCAKANSRRKGLSRKINLCTEACTSPPLHVDTALQGPHTTANGVNTVNMANGTVDIGDFNTKHSAGLKSLN